MFDNSATPVARVMESDVNQKIIHLKVNEADWRKERKFLKDRNQLETVLGPSRVSWFDELTERALLCKKEVKKENKTVFDSPVCSPTVSQLIKNQLKVGNSPPQFYHSSPALESKSLFDDGKFSTPDHHGHWCRPTLGISPSPVPKDGSFFRRSSSIMGSLGLSNDDSVLSWSNSLATPPRDDVTIVSTSCTPTHHKDPVRALFSSSPHQDTTTESLEPLESTNEEEILPDEDNAETKQSNYTESKINISDTKITSHELNQDLSQGVSLPNEKSMEAWRDKFRRKLILKSDSFGKRISSPGQSYKSKSDENKKIESSNAIIHISNKQFSDIETEKKVCEGDVANRILQESGEENKTTNKELNDGTENISVKSEKEETCLSPVFPKQSNSSRQSSTKPKRVISRTEVVGEALSDFFDSPAGAVGKRNLNRKRKSSEMDLTEFDKNLKDIESMLSTPKTVVLQSILMKDKQSRGSSGKKVRFSENVVKYSEEKAKNGSFSKKRRKHLNAKRTAVLEELKQVSLEKDQEIKTDKSADTSDHKSDELSNMLSMEGDDVFSQVSPTALEAMCSAALISCDKDKNMVTCAGDNSLVNNQERKIFDPGKNILKEMPSKLKRFLYPTKHNLVKTNQSEIFKYKEDEKGDNRGKGIVSAIEGSKILHKTDIQNSEEDEKFKPSSAGEDVDTSAIKVVEKLINDESTCFKVINSDMGELETVNQFQSASGRDISVTDGAIKKAKILFDEEDSAIKPLENKEVNIKMNPEKSDSTKVSFENDKKGNYLEKYEEEDFESQLWFEDFDNIQENFNQVEEDEHEIDFDKHSYKGVTGNRSCKFTEIECKENELNESSSGFINEETLSNVECKINQNEEKKDLLKETLKTNDYFANIESRQPDLSKIANQPLISQSYTNGSSSHLTCQSHLGFSMASGKALQFDDEKLKKAEQIFSSTDDFYHELSLTDSKTVKRYKNENEAHVEDIICVTNASNDLEQNSKTSRLVGFSFASGESLVLSKSTIEGAQTMLKDDAQLDSNLSNTKLSSALEQSVNASRMAGFTTASGKTFKLSKHAKERAQTMFNDVTELESNFENRDSDMKLSHTPEHLLSVSSMTGFTTASGKAFSLSKISMEKAENILNEETKYKYDSANIVKGNNKEKPKNVPLHELFKEELEHSDKAMDVDLLNQEITSFKSTLVKFNSASDVNKTASASFVIKGSGSKSSYTDKPKGFRPFKAPKRITVKSLDSKSDCLSSNAATSNEQNTTPSTNETETKMSIQQSNRKHANDQVTGVKIESTNNKHSDIVQERISNVTAKQDVYEGIFSQMFADDMEPEELSTAEHNFNKEEKITLFASTTVGNTNTDENGKDMCNINNDLSKSKGVSEIGDYAEVASEVIKNKKISSSNQNMTNIGSLSNSEGNENTTVLKDMSEKTPFPGFQTAGGKNLFVSESALETARNNFDDEKTIEKVETIASEDITDLTEVSRKTIISSNSEKFSSITPFLGMGTVSLKSDHSVEELNESSHDSVQVLDKERVNNLKASESMISKVLKCDEVTLNNEELKPNRTIYMGFQTAGGKEVKVSEKALEKAKTTLNDAHGFSDEQNLSDIKENGKECSLFFCKKVEENTTKFDIPRSSDNLPIFENLSVRQNDIGNLDKVTEVATETMKNKEPEYKTPLALGFKNAGGKDIKISEKSLNGATHILEKEENTLSNPAHLGFQALMRDETEISDRSLKEADSSDIKIASNPPFIGFQTAGGRDIHISDISLEEAKKALTTERDLQSKHGQAFQTVGGTFVENTDRTFEVVRKSKNKEDNLSCNSAQVKGPKSSTTAFEEARQIEEKVLDHLPLMGFKTATGKDIIISDNSVIEARKTSNYEEEVEKNHIDGEKDISVPIRAMETARNPLNNKDNVTAKLIGFQSACSLDTSVSDRSLDEVRAQNGEDKFYLNQPFMGFTTAGGKSIKISERSIEEARKTLNDNEEFSEKRKFIGFQTARGKNITISEKALEITGEKFKTEDHSFEKTHLKDFKQPNETIDSLTKTSNTENISNRQVAGFETASKRDVKATDITLQKANKMLDEGDGYSYKPELIRLDNATGNSTGISENVPSTSRSSSNSVTSTESKLPFKGFETANGNNITISEKALQAARNNLNSEEVYFKGFHSAAVKNISVSGKALTAARNSLNSVTGNVHGLHSSEEQSDNHISNKAETFLKDGDESQEKSFGGFQTASGSKITFSDEALQVVRQQLISEELIGQPIMTGFQTARGNKVNLSSDSLNKARETLSSIDNGIHDSNITTINEMPQAARMNMNSENAFTELPTMTGFQTARGKKVKLSADSLKKARETLSNVDNNRQVSEILNDWTIVSTNNKTERFAIENVQEIYSNDTAANRANFLGFQTASGTNVKVSDKVLKYARGQHMELFSELQSDKLTANNMPKVSSTDIASKTSGQFQGFQTASGTKVQVSDKALEHARGQHLQLFDELGSCELTSSSDHAHKMSSTDIATKTKGLFTGFQTASGTNVQVSDKALEYARGQHLDESDRLTVPDNVFKICSTDIVTKTSDHFEESQTSHGTNIQVSEKVLEHAGGKKIQSVTQDDNHRPKTSSSPNEIDDMKIISMLDSELSIKRQKLGCYQERHIPHKPGNTDNQMKRKSLRSTPEGITTDRRHPGFRPFKPVICRKIEKQQQQSKEVTASKPAPNTEMKTFQTPYKKSSNTKVQDKLQVSNTISAKTPVFNCKLKHGPIGLMDHIDVRKDIFKGNDLKPTNHETHSEIEQNEKGACKIKSKDCVENVLPSMSVKVCEKVQNSKNSFQQNEVSLSETYNVEKVVSHDLVMETSDMSSFSQDEDDMYYCNLVEARTRQNEIIETRKKKKVEPVMGRLYELKKSGCRMKVADIWTNKEIKIEKKVQVASTTAADYKFEIKDHYGNQSAHVLLGDGAFLVPDDNGKAGKQEFYRAFLTMEGVDCKLISDVWLYNHYRWIVWKLAAYELTPCFNGRSLTPENVMLQLKYRYDREIDRAERSCLKKIYEKDDTPCKRLVLCVSNLTYNKDKVTNVSNPDLPKVSGEMTDGWYKIPVQFDGPLTELCCQGRVEIGQKLCISGAELVGSQDACTPLEAPADLHLKINTNSTRPAKWDCHLGYQTDPRPLCVPLVNLYEEGGNIGVIDVVLVRKYPIMYMEKLASGGCVFRTQRDEERVQQQCQSRKQVEVEKLYNQIQKEMELEQKQDTSQKKGKRKYSMAEIEQLCTGEEIHDALENSVQPDKLQNYLSDHQQGLLYEYQRCLQDEKRHKLNMRVQSAWQEREDETPTERNVTPVLKFRVAGCANMDLDAQKSTILTVWRPASEISDLKEGKRYKIYSLSASSSRSKYTGSSVQLTATKQTKFMQLEIDENLLDRIYEPREVLWVNDIKRRQPPFGELDFVGWVVRVVVACSNNSVRSPDMMYLADCQCNLLGVKFWNGIKSSGEDLCTEGTCVCLSNLMDKSAYRNTYLPTVEATTEFTNITRKPQNPGQRHAFDKLHSILKNKPSFKDDVVTTLDDILSNKHHRKSPIEKNLTFDDKRDNLFLQTASASNFRERVITGSIAKPVDKDKDSVLEDTELCFESIDEFSFSEEINVEDPGDVVEQNLLDETDSTVSKKIEIGRAKEDDFGESPAKRLKEDSVVSKTACRPSNTDTVNTPIICSTPVRNTGNENSTTLASESATPASQSKSSQVQSRFAKLSMYGTPDILSPLPVSVPRSVSKGFKPPSFRKKLN